jgi:hypothetical protein
MYMVRIFALMDDGHMDISMMEIWIDRSI